MSLGIELATCRVGGSNMFTNVAIDAFKPAGKPYRKVNGTSSKISMGPNQCGASRLSE